MSINNVQNNKVNNVPKTNEPVNNRESVYNNTNKITLNNPKKPVENNVGLLIDLNEPSKVDNKPKYSDKGLFSQLQFENNSDKNQFNQEAYNHNQAIFNNLNINFGEEDNEEYPSNDVNIFFC